MRRALSGESRAIFLALALPFLLTSTLMSPNQSLQLPGRPSRGEATTARSAACGGTLLAKVVSFLVWRGVAAGGPQLSSIR